MLENNDSDHFKESKRDAMNPKASVTSEIPEEIKNSIAILEKNDSDFYLSAINSLSSYAQLDTYLHSEYFRDDFFARLHQIFINSNKNLRIQAAILELIKSFCHSNVSFVEKFVDHKFHIEIGEIYPKHVLRDELVISALMTLAKSNALVFCSLDKNLLNSLLDDINDYPSDLCYALEPLYTYFNSPHFLSFSPKLSEKVFNICSKFLIESTQPITHWIELAYRLAGVVIEKETKPVFWERFFEEKLLFRSVRLIGFDNSLTESIMLLYVALTKTDASVDKIVSTYFIPTVLKVFSIFTEITSEQSLTFSYLWSFLYNVILSRNDVEICLPQLLPYISDPEVKETDLEHLLKLSINGPNKAKLEAVNFISLLIVKLPAPISFQFVDNIGFYQAFDVIISEGYTQCAVYLLIAINALKNNADHEYSKTNLPQFKTRCDEIEQHFFQEDVYDACQEIVESSDDDYEKRIASYIIETIEEKMEPHKN